MLREVAEVFLAKLHYFYLILKFNMEYFTFYVMKVFSGSQMKVIALKDDWKEASKRRNELTWKG